MDNSEQQRAESPFSQFFSDRVFARDQAKVSPNVARLLINIEKIGNLVIEHLSEINLTLSWDSRPIKSKTPLPCGGIQTNSKISHPPICNTM